MPSSRTEHDHDPGGSLTLRPRSAVVICVIGGVIALVLAVEAVLGAGWRGVAALPVLLLIVALGWMVLWAPRVVLHEDSIEVRNIVLTHLAPFAAIEAVRVGAMLRLDVRTRDRGTRTITAWNAPSVGRDHPLRRQADMREQELRGRRLGPQERLVRDQARSRSAVIRERWLRWDDAQEASGMRNGSDPAAEAAVMTTRLNIPVLVVVGVCVVLVALQLAL